MKRSLVVIAMRNLSKLHNASCDDVEVKPSSPRKFLNGLIPALQNVAICKESFACFSLFEANPKMFCFVSRLHDSSNYIAKLRESFPH